MDELGISGLVMISSSLVANKYLVLDLLNLRHLKDIK